ncbi:methionine biosynthesis protein MetW [Candidatus Nitrosocosmicus arcticus]|uniref:Putative Methionine biosynthesis protein MetW n=1 Tax=Candidatus Nitrosocosmicus arcticus TaxID=2035267 RepID=A0A557SYM8_9ARCH|nr:methionine biosynthesis protein MetW [Candidatus Nitrosocosmicus arcticus]TVP41702.1 putative Methionine biosynthesis protein MetW [Candidatus Nitrosocosmicus arcticus]
MIILLLIVKHFIVLSKEILNSLTDNFNDFPEMFEDYDKYHSNVSTGKLLRFELIKNWVIPDSTILDVGVGDGLMSELFVKNKNASILGMDISNVACEKAKERGIPVVVKDINNGLCLNEDEFYDYILLIEVIEHTIYPQKILQDALAHCKKGVIVTIPNSAYIKWRIQLMRGFSPRQSFTHLHYWSINDFKIFCRKLDIEILDSKFSLPPWLLRFNNLLAWQQCWLLSPKLKLEV